MLYPFVLGTETLLELERREKGTEQTSGVFFLCDTGPGKSCVVEKRVERVSYLICLKEYRLTY